MLFSSYLWKLNNLTYYYYYYYYYYFLVYQSKHLFYYGLKA